ncbi:MAG: flippase-like domain-containing protein [Methanobrevibacter sp.]|nr:flippase-like domain-containing protein [Candidatus Methanovirga basalitermitum]
MKKAYLFIISAILLVFMIWLIGVDKIIESIRTSNPYLILLATIINFITLIIRTLRWGYIINKVTSFKDNFIVKMIGLFAANITPVRTGGEVFTAVAGKEINGISLSKGISTGFIERSFDGLVSFALLFLCIFLFPKDFLSGANQIILLIAILAVSGYLIVIYLFNWRENFSLYLYNILHRIIKILPISESFLDAVHDKVTCGLKDMVKCSMNFSNKKNFFTVFILSLSSWIFECLRLYLVIRAFNIDIPFFAVIFIFFIADIAGLVSLLPGGMGSLELSTAHLLTSFSVPFAVAGTIILIDRFISYWIINLIGMIFTLYYTGDIFKSIKKSLT